MQAKRQGLSDCKGTPPTYLSTFLWIQSRQGVWPCSAVEEKEKEVRAAVSRTVLVPPKWERHAELRRSTACWAVPRALMKA